VDRRSACAVERTSAGFEATGHVFRGESHAACNMDMGTPLLRAHGCVPSAPRSVRTGRRGEAAAAGKADGAKLARRCSGGWLAAKLAAQAATRRWWTALRQKAERQLRRGEPTRAGLERMKRMQRKQRESRWRQHLRASRRRWRACCPGRTGRSGASRSRRSRRARSAALALRIKRSKRMERRAGCCRRLLLLLVRQALLDR